MQPGWRPGLVTGGVVTAIVLIATLGVFAIPALVGALLIGGIARGRGRSPERTRPRTTLSAP